MDCFNTAPSSSSCIFIPQKTRELMTRLIDSGFEAFAVGGCVRDSYLGFAPHDWDICSNALPHEMQKVFCGLHVIETGLKHGTLTVMLEHEPFEITTYRRDGEYLDYRHPEKVEFVSDLREDLSRRDFTINAMAADTPGNIIDFFGGREDIEKRLVRCVGEPDKRFSEDALRILRALRFASRFGFDIEENTQNAILKNRFLLENISAERIAKELEGILLGKYCGDILRDYHEVFSVFMPETAQASQRWVSVVSQVQSTPEDLYVRLALLYCTIDGQQNVAQIAEKSMKALKLDNLTVELVSQLVRECDRAVEPDKPLLRRLLNEMGHDQLIRLISLKKAVFKNENLPEAEITAMLDEIERNGECFSLRDLAVKGGDLLNIGFASDKQLGVVLKHLLDAVIDGKLPNDKETLLTEAKRTHGNS